MEVLACIPELPRPADRAPVAPPIAEHRRLSEPASAPIAAAETTMTADVDTREGEDVDDAATVSPGPQRSPARRSRPSGLFSPSIIALAAVATVVWAAAWRNDRLRLEAARQQRPERLALELPATAGAARKGAP